MQIAFSGAAGTGINTLGVLFGRFLASRGVRVIGDREYASIIKGDNNVFLLSFSLDDRFVPLSRTIDAFFSLDDFGVAKNQKIYTLDLVYVMEKSLPYKRRNMYLLGQAVAICGFLCATFEHFLAQGALWALTEENISALRAGYASITLQICDLSGYLANSREFIGGNELLAQGAIASGMDFYSAYPMTPASSIIDEVIRHPEQVAFIQGEDEVAVGMMMLGAKFSGSRAMCGTSGGGFALMSEAIAYSHQAEIGGVYVLSQRAGPSTGTPTFQEQSDLNYAIHASFGDTRPVVLAPSTYEQAYALIGEALNISDTLQHPVIVLIDKQWSESLVSIDRSSLTPSSIHRGKLEMNPLPDFARYSLCEDGISPYSLPGTPYGEYIATSYEHDEYGTTSEDAHMKVAMTEKRMRKLDSIETCNEPISAKGYTLHNPEAKIFFVTYGFNAYLFQEYTRSYPEFGAIILERISPFPQQLTHFLQSRSEHINELRFVDGNMSGQLGSWVTSQASLERYYERDQLTILKNYHLYPWFMEDFDECRADR